MCMFQPQLPSSMATFLQTSWTGGQAQLTLPCAPLPAFADGKCSIETQVYCTFQHMYALALRTTSTYAQKFDRRTADAKTGEQIPAASATWRACSYKRGQTTSWP